MPETETIVHCRWMIRRDMGPVQELENNYSSNRWTEDEMIREFRRRDSVGMIAENVTTDEIGAYMIYHLYRGMLHIVRFVCDLSKPNIYANALVDKLFSKLSPERRRHLIITVPDDDLEMQLFFKEKGFRCMEVKKQYFDQWTDAYVMQYSIMPDGKPLSGEINGNCNS